MAILSDLATSLDALGWDASLENARRGHPASADHLPARVVRQERGWVWLDTGGQQLRAETSGRLRHRAEQASDLPIIGDWVLIPDATTKDDATAVITDILPRKTVLLRQRVGGIPGAQPLAANVDVALIVVGLDRALSLELLGRGVVIARSGGVEPIVVLNKADLCADWAERAGQVNARFPGLQAISLSTVSGQGTDVLSATIGAHRTATMIGPSGVGKSSLLNRLHGADVMKTGAVRTDDRKGTHTTTHRQLFSLPSGALLIDGPGMRELGAWGNAEAVTAAFPEVVAVASRCRRRACQHQAEFGCAVQFAIRDGSLSAVRLADYRKLLEGIAGSGRRPRRHTSRKRPS